MRFEDSDLAEATAVVELSVLASCPEDGWEGADPAEALIQIEVTPDKPTGTLGELRSGRYGLLALGYSATCDLVAGGCEPIRVDTGHDGALSVSLSFPSRPEPVFRCGGGELCSGGRCAVLDAGNTCPPGYGDCDSNPDCETPLGTMSHCAACNDSCAVAHGTGACMEGRCEFIDCAAGFEDCNEDVSDGCEADLSQDPDHCSRCGAPCPWSCVEGACDDVVAVSARNRTCARTATGAAYCWTATSSPQRVEGLTAAQVTAGGTFACARLDTGSVVCWGDNAFGQLGSTSVGSSTSPLPVPGLTDVTQLDAGERHACAVRTNGMVVCWGANDRGQLGRSGDGGGPQTVAGLGMGASMVSAGATHTCAVLEDRTVACWGDADLGALGNALASGVQSAPVLVDGLTNGSTLDLGAARACVLKTNHRVECWGNISVSTDGTVVGAIATGVSSRSIVQEVAVGDAHACIRQSIGGTVCWGHNAEGQLADGTTDRRTDLTPIALPEGATSVTDLSAGRAHTCALLDNSEVWCWGDGYWSGTPAPRRMRVAVE